ncbi:MAG: YcgL domain-containing protein [Gammaproteobacteria bacterium]|nr:YcgL domain-containing protein [Gammaproteobacteria bacterium]MCK5335348.1 YcgL domain-containing protein [Gammaproteobacteria bacterium]
MNCYIYRCSAKNDMYIFLKDQDDFSVVPKNILKSIGDTEFTMEIEMSAERKLAKEDPQTVLNNLDEHGFHLQLPSDKSIEEVMTEIANSSRQKK